MHIDKEDEDGSGSGIGEDREIDQAEKEEMAQALRAEQAVLAHRGAAIMCEIENGGGGLHFSRLAN